MATREEEIRVKVTGAQAAERDLDRFGDAAQDAGKHVGILGKESGGTAKRVDELGDQAKGTERELSRLDRQILETSAAIHRLNAEYDKGGDPKVLKQLQEQQAAYSKIETTRKRISKLQVDDAKNAQQAVKRLVDVDLSGGKGKGLFADVKGLFGAGASQAGQIGGQVGQTVGSSNLLTGAALGAGAAGLPVLGAAAGGAVLAGAGIGAVGGGIAGALGGPHGDAIKAEFSALTADLSDRWHKSTADWWQPLVEGERTLGDAMAQLPIEEIFGNAEKYIKPLAAGVAGFTAAIGRGTNTLVREAGPVIDALSEKLPEVGRDIEEAMDAIAAGAPGAAKGLGDVLSVTGELIKDTGILIYGFESLYDKAGKTPVLKQGHELFMNMFGSDTQDAITQVGMSLTGTASSTADAGDAAAKAAADVQRLSNAFDTLFGSTMSSDEAAIQYEASVDALTGSVERNGRSLDITTEKGRANKQAILDTVDAIDREREAAIAAGDGSKAATDKANAAYQAQLESLRRQLGALGLNKAAVDALIASYENIPTRIETSLVLHHVDTYSSTGSKKTGNSRLGAGDQYAAGGTVRNTGWSLVGENGPEMRWLNKGDEISTASETRQMMSGGGGGPSARQVVEALPPMSVIEQVFAAVGMRLMNSGQWQVPSRAVV